MTSEATHIQPSARHDPSVILDVEQLSKRFPIARGLVLRRDVGAVQAVRDASFRVRRGATLGLVGESGSGKSTTARCILRLIDPTSGRVWFRPNPNDAPVDVASAGRQQLQRVRREMQVVFQDPYASLDPKMRVEAIVAEPLAVHGIGSRHDRRDRVRELLEVVGLQRGHAERFPHEFSGGQRQRIALARALVLEPTFIVLDEPTSALDMLIQSQMVDLLRDLQKKRDLTYLFISHDLRVVAALASRLLVLRNGKMVEEGAAAELFKAPKNAYTRALFAAAFNLETAAEGVVAQ